MINAEGKEFRRQIFHIVFGCILIFLIIINALDVKLLFLILALGFIASLISLKIKIPVIGWFLKNFDRNKDTRTFPGKGAFFYIFGILLALWLFDKDIALASIAIMVFGDSISHLVGTAIKKSRFRKIGNNKNVEGVIVGMIIGGFCSSFFVSIYYAFSASIIAMLVEGFGLKMGEYNIDDNLFIPLISGVIITLLRANLWSLA